MATPESDREICDVAIIGAGPAGLGAATRLKALGVETVVVLDREPEAGGIPRHCGHYPFGLREFTRLLKGPAYAERLVAKASRAGVDLRPAATAVRLEPGPSIIVSTSDGLRKLVAKRILLATGVRETSRAARFIGGERPLGIMPTGALQSMVYLHDTRPFSRPVIVGTELVSFSALLTCRHAGIRPVAMIEQNTRVTARAFAAGLPKLLGIPLMLGAELVDIIGHPRVEAVRISGSDGEHRTIACDGVILTGGFVPEATLAHMCNLDIDPGTGGPIVNQYGQCSDPHVFAAGNLLRPVETSGWSWQEGVVAADRIQASLTGQLPDPDQYVRLKRCNAAIRYVVPQHLSLPHTDRGMQAQLRVNTPARGVLTARVDGAQVWSRRMHALPERRILMPLDPFRGIRSNADIHIDITGV